jgi:hypothetical protein
MLSVSSYTTSHTSLVHFCALPGMLLQSTVTFAQEAEDTNQVFIAALKYYQAYWLYDINFRHNYVFSYGSLQALFYWYRCHNLHIFLLITNRLFYFTDLTAF